MNNTRQIRAKDLQRGMVVFTSPTTTYTVRTINQGYLMLEISVLSTWNIRHAYKPETMLTIFKH